MVLLLYYISSHYDLIGCAHCDILEKGPPGSINKAILINFQTYPGGPMSRSHLKVNVNVKRTSRLQFFYIDNYIIKVDTTGQE